MQTFSNSIKCTQSRFLVGTRVQDNDGYKATIKYIGPVAASKNKEEIWLGVEWDDKARGKHDGSCVEDGILYRYFDCAMGAGSFIKASKLRPLKSFYEALTERYVSIDAPEVTQADSTLPGAFVSTAKGNQKQIQFVGEKQIRKWQQISAIDKVTIRNDGISTVGTITDNDTSTESDAASCVGTIASHFVEIDLQDNLIWEWKEVFALGLHMPRLQSLLLHRNKLQQLTESLLNALPYANSLRGLRRLALNGTGLDSWDRVHLLDRCAPALEELYLADNQLWDLPCVGENAGFCNTGREGINDPVTENDETYRLNVAAFRDNDFVTGFTYLRLLDLSSCGLDSWARVLSLGRLPALEQLAVDDNPLGRVLPCPSYSQSAESTDNGNRLNPESLSEAQSLFPRLSRLSLSSTGLSSWSDIDALSTYYGGPLSQVRLADVPLFKGLGASEARPLAIGRISSLIVFNGSQVSDRERRDAEKIYLRSILREQSQLSHASTPSQSHFASSSTSVSGSAVDATATSSVVAKMMALHPRYAELKARYQDEMLPLSRGAEGPGQRTLAAELVSVKITCVAVSASSSSSSSINGVEKKLPCSLTVARLKQIVKQLYGILPEEQQLALRVDRESIPIVLDDNSSTLSYYGIAEDSEIFVNVLN